MLLLGIKLSILLLGYLLDIFVFYFVTITGTFSTAKSANRRSVVLRMVELLCGHYTYRNSLIW